MDVPLQPKLKKGNEKIHYCKINKIVKIFKKIISLYLIFASIEVLDDKNLTLNNTYYIIVCTHMTIKYSIHLYKLWFVLSELHHTNSIIGFFQNMFS